MCVNAYLRLRSLRKTSALLGVSKSTLQRWANECPIVHRRRNARKVTSEVTNLISDTISKHPFYTPAVIATTILKELKLRISASTVRVWMKRGGFSRKKAFRVVASPSLEAARIKFAADYAAMYDADRVVSVDESSFYFDMAPSFGYCSRSKRLRIPARAGGRVRWSLIMAVTNQRVVGWKLVKGSINSGIFADFMQNLEMDERDVVLLDNASIHKTGVSMDTMVYRGLTPCFLPPYTPEFQPIEHCFSVLKQSYRLTNPSETAVVFSDKLDDVVSRLETCLPKLSPTTLKNQFDACWKRAAEYASKGRDMEIAGWSGGQAEAGQMGQAEAGQAGQADVGQAGEGGYLAT